MAYRRQGGSGYLMGEPASDLPPYIGPRPVEYRGIVLGLERISTVWGELTRLGEQEWEEVGDEERLGTLEPDFLTCLQHEQAGRIGVVTARLLGSWELAGYFVGVMGTPLKTKGKKTLNEVAIYLTPEVRSGWLAVKLLEYTEVVAKAFGADALIVSHRPEHERIGALYQRRGFAPLSHDYIKRIDHD